MLKSIIQSPHVNPTNAFRLLVAMHVAGAIGLALPQSRDFFQFLTPFNLLATAAIVFHFEEKKEFNYILFLVVTFLAGFFVEVAGVKTGAIFGAYQYGETLGLQWLEVPLAIGLNWVVLIYATGIFSDQFKLPPVVKALIGALLMVLLDLLIEPVAIKLDFWTWQAETIPLQNYMAWFAVSVILQLLYQFLPFSKNNSLAIRLLYIQGLFFLGLNFI